MFQKLFTIIPTLLAVLVASSHARAAAASPLVIGAEADGSDYQDRRSLRAGDSGLLQFMDPKTLLHKLPPPSVASSDQCCVPCTTPVNACCLQCSAIASPREHDLLMASLEGLTTYIMDKHKGEHDFLVDRSWTGNGNVGNRPLQATFYYDWIRSLPEDGVRHVCEIGLNGGHSAVIFLAALSGRATDVVMTTFDLLAWKYSPTAVKYLDALYPGKMKVVKGKSNRTVNPSNLRNGEQCDVFSVDGGHRYFETSADIERAVEVTRKGGIILLDDMNPGSKTRAAFDNAVTKGLVEDPRCVEGVVQKVGYVDRVDETSARTMSLSWCMATVV
eukprot:CAMPEP_0172533782 /NCGR_PEP_ID=MMETSP1067-20121228/6366_1 /TAXON_ID=265564 ORGANISM="Thalassiosira punctigera, Strain Tpunct2005C2" /NCGR_SAMPLE_ID=MMETSP1067 /ASSEMBLY_ACC=CAM_ASM_000444 /LENGTH=330 /DNA_ID=CAMNT_0013318471 /DNA_START=23 /DNA_END=1015 /DNA_ORIENTATION=-